MAKIKSQQAKSGIKWIDGFKALVRPITTLFWIIVYPLLTLYLVKEGIITSASL
ncbi:hypothetical protein G653_04551 [Candidatus Liberibacter americanus PW_SP]|nr:hypothetical protein G653_04551 [Candidatus Liberibacter americanus PW_SP]